MAIYFHLAPTLLAPGSIIEPGNFGRIVLLHGLNHQQYRREIQYEEARKTRFPDRPSRLACLFAFVTQEEAELFQRTIPGFGANVLYEIENNEQNPHVADIAYAIQPPGATEFDQKTIDYYWGGWRELGIPGAVTLREVLLRMPATILRRV